MPGTLARGRSTACWSTSNTPIEAPSAASRATRVRPIPLAPPVTRTRLPARSMVVDGSALRRGRVREDHSSDLRKTRHLGRFVAIQLNVKTALECDNQFNVPENNPGGDIVHRRGPVDQ